MGKVRTVLMMASLILMVEVLVLGNPYTHQALAENVIKFGSVGPLSGQVAAWGIPGDRAIRLLADEINAKGGLKVGGETYKFEIVSADDKFTADGARSAALKLVERDKVKYAVGGIFKFETFSLMSVFEAGGVIHFHNGWGDELVRPDAPHSFRCTVTPQEFTAAIHLALLQIYPKVKRWAFVGMDEPGTKEVSAQMRSFMPALGLEVAADEYFPPDAVEFTSLVTKVLRSQADGIAVSGASPTQDGLICKQARLKGFKGPIMHPAPLSARDIIASAGGEAAEGFLTYGPVEFGPLAEPKMKAFQEKYLKKYGSGDSGSLNISYSFEIIVEAMKAANSVDVDKVLHVLQAGGPFETTVGPAYIAGKEIFGINNQVFQSCALSVIKNGEFVPIKKITGKEQLDLTLKYYKK
jgi:branched-chain amino acid transport system substrate-binding protein